MHIKQTITDRRYHALKMPLIYKFKGAGLKTAFYKLEDSIMSAWTGGNGFPFILLHGFGPSALWQWYGQVKAFARKYSLVVPDLIYFGQSISKKADYRTEFQAENIVRLADFLKIERFHVMGLSYGGIVAYQVAKNFSSRVAKLIIVDSPGIPFVQSDYERALQTFQTKSIHDIVMPENPNDFSKLFDISLYRPPFIPKFIVRDLHRIVFSTQWEEKRKLLDYLQDSTLASEEEVSCSAFCLDVNTLFIWGRYDQLIPLDVGQRLAQKMGGKTRIEIIDNTRHTPNMEKPKEFNRIVLDFLNG